MAIIVTEPYSDYRKGSSGAVIVKEVSGVTTAVQARAACRLDRNSPHPEDSSYICDNWDSQKLAPDFLRMTFSFAPKDFADQNNPLATPMRIKWDVGLSLEQFDRDINGNPIVNSALDPFDTPFQVEVPELTLDVVRWEPAPFDFAKAASFVGTVNEGTLKIAGVPFKDGQVFVRRIAPLNDYTLDARAIEVGYSFCLRAQGWDIRVMDQGFRAWNKRYSAVMEICTPPEPNSPNPTTDPVQVTKAVLLNGKGKPISSKFVTAGKDTFDDKSGPPTGAKVEIVPDKSAVFLHYKRYKRSKLQLLGL